MRGFSTPLNVGSAGSGVGTIVNFDLMAVRVVGFFLRCLFLLVLLKKVSYIC